MSRLFTLFCWPRSLRTFANLDCLRVFTMSLQSDLDIDASKFDRKLADKQTEEFNEKLIMIWADGPRWYEVRHPLTGCWAELTEPGRRRRVPQASLGRQDTTAKARRSPGRHQWHDTVARSRSRDSIPRVQACWWREQGYPPTHPRRRMGPSI